MDEVDEQTAVEQDRRLEEKLRRAGARWQTLHYSGPDRLPEPVARSFLPRIAWALGACAAIVLVVSWPGAQPEINWPENLRPITRSSPFSTSVPARPAARLSFSLPAAPDRASCIAGQEGCEQPTG